jgi:hypothetical protein
MLAFDILDVSDIEFVKYFSLKIENKIQKDNSI